MTSGVREVVLIGIWNIGKISLGKEKLFQRARFHLTHSRRALFRVFDIELRQMEDISGIILVKEFFKKSN